jgi:glutathione S-transferase
MSELTLVIGDKNLSSWSLRSYLALAATGAPFREVLVRLDQPTTRQEILAAKSPTGKVPLLLDGELVVWESLAICEYLAERFPKAGLWPEESRARARARSVSHEMHAGFASLRKEHPMNIAALIPKAPSLEVRAEVDRIEQIWAHCRRRHGQSGPYLFGRWTIADCMYAPVTTRMRTYQIPVSIESGVYIDAVHAWPGMQTWTKGAEAEVRASC